MEKLLKEYLQRKGEEYNLPVRDLLIECTDEHGLCLTKLVWNEFIILEKNITF